MLECQYRTRYLPSLNLLLNHPAQQVLVGDHDAMDEMQLGRPELAAIIGERLRDVRRARGLSQQALAEGLFSKGYVSSIEHGKIFPSVRALQALAARLGVDMSEFF